MRYVKDTQNFRKTLDFTLSRGSESFEAVSKGQGILEPCVLSKRIERVEGMTQLGLEAYVHELRETNAFEQNNRLELTLKSGSQPEKTKTSSISSSNQKRGSRDTCGTKGLQRCGPRFCIIGLRTSTAPLNVFSIQGEESLRPIPRELLLFLFLEPLAWIYFVGALACPGAKRDGG